MEVVIDEATFWVSTNLMRIKRRIIKKANESNVGKLGVGHMLTGLYDRASHCKAHLLVAAVSQHQHKLFTDFFISIR